MDIIPLNKDHNSILFYNKIDNVELIKKYPVNEAVLDEGLYNETKLKGMLENKLDQYSVKNYNWNIRDWNVTDFMSSKFFLLLPSVYSIFTVRPRLVHFHVVNSLHK